MEAKLRLLIVDDDELVLELMKHVARRVARLSIETTTEPAQAVTWIRTREAPFHLVLTDLVMPEISGLDVLRQARMRSPDTRGMIVTGFDDQQSITEAIKLGVFDYLRKPFRREELDLSLRRAIEYFDLRTQVSTQEAQLATLRAEAQQLAQMVTERQKQLQESSTRVAEYHAQKNEEQKLERVLKTRNVPTDVRQFAVMRQLQDLGSLFQAHQITQEEFHLMRKSLLDRAYNSMLY